MHFRIIHFIYRETRPLQASYRSEILLARLKWHIRPSVVANFCVWWLNLVIDLVISRDLWPSPLTFDLLTFKFHRISLLICVRRFRYSYGLNSWDNWLLSVVSASTPMTCDPSTNSPCVTFNVINIAAGNLVDFRCASQWCIYNFRKEGPSLIKACDQLCFVNF